MEVLGDLANGETGQVEERHRAGFDPREAPQGAEDVEPHERGDGLGFRCSG